MLIEILTKGAEDKYNKRFPGAPKLKFKGELESQDEYYMHISRTGKKLAFNDQGKMLRERSGKPKTVKGKVIQSIPKRIIEVWKEVQR